MSGRELMQLWAKRSRNPDEAGYHPLVCHLIDVAAVADLLWSQALSPFERGWMAGELGLSETAARGWLRVWAGLHDIGVLTGVSVAGTDRR
jgi:CRISPR-associated endonuclease/helicase Cas3